MFEEACKTAGGLSGRQNGLIDTAHIDGDQELEFITIKAQYGCKAFNEVRLQPCHVQIGKRSSSMVSAAQLALQVLDTHDDLHLGSCKLEGLSYPRPEQWPESILPFPQVSLAVQRLGYHVRLPKVSAAGM